MICSPASLICARYGQPNHVAAHKANTPVLAATIHEMKSLYFSFCSIVGAFWMQYET